MERERTGNLKREALLLYAITDSGAERDRPLAVRVEDALKGGATCVQLREKKLTGEDLYREAEQVLAVCRSYHVPLIINDDVELALRLDADGVHVGQKDMEAKEARRRLGPGKIVGVSARTVEQAERPGRTERITSAWELCSPPDPRRMRGRLITKRFAGSALRFPFRRSPSAALRRRMRCSLRAAASAGSL